MIAARVLSFAIFAVVVRILGVRSCWGSLGFHARLDIHDEHQLLQE